MWGKERRGFRLISWLEVRYSSIGIIPLNQEIGRRAFAFVCVWGGLASGEEYEEKCGESKSGEEVPPLATDQKHRMD